MPYSLKAYCYRAVSYLIANYAIIVLIIPDHNSFTYFITNSSITEECRIILSHVMASSLPTYNICSPKSTNVYYVAISAFT